MKTYKEQKGFLQVNYRDFRIIFIQWFIICSLCQVDMFCHQAVGMKSMSIFFKAFRDKKQEPASVLFVKKYILAALPRRMTW